MSNFLQVTDITGIKVGDTVVFRDGRTDVVKGVGKFGYPIEEVSLDFQNDAPFEVEETEEFYFEPYANHYYRPDGINKKAASWDIVEVVKA